MTDAGHATPRGSPFFLIGSIAFIVLALGAVVSFVPLVSCSFHEVPPGAFMNYEQIAYARACDPCQPPKKLTLLQYYWVCTCPK